MTMLLTATFAFAAEGNSSADGTNRKNSEDDVIIAIDKDVPVISIGKAIGGGDEVGTNGVKERYRITTKVVSTKTDSYYVTTPQSVAVTTLQAVIIGWYTSYFGIPQGIASGLASGVISLMAYPYPAGKYTFKREFLQKVQTSYTTGKSKVIGSGYRVTTTNSKGSYTVTRWA